MKITGNGKFISPGVVVIDWKILKDLKRVCQFSIFFFLHSLPLKICTFS